MLAQKSSQRNKFISIGINATPFLVYQFDQGGERSVNNLYNYQLGLSAKYTVVFNKHFISLSTGINYSTKNFKTIYNGSPDLLEGKHHYSFVKIPILIGYNYSVGNNLLGAGFGLQFCMFSGSSYTPKSKDNSYDQGFPSDLSFSPFRELIIYLDYSRILPKYKFQLGIQPFIQWHTSTPDFYSNSFYNIGKQAIGISLIFSKNINLN